MSGEQLPFPSGPDIQAMPDGRPNPDAAPRALSDAQWARIANLVSGKPEDRGSTGRDNRMFVEAVLWIARTGAAWRDLPPHFGAWNTVFRRHRRWLQGGVWQRVFAALRDDPGFGYALQGQAVRADEWHH
jgi:putative transposase